MHSGLYKIFVATNTKKTVIVVDAHCLSGVKSPEIEKNIHVIGQ